MSQRIQYTSNNKTKKFRGGIETNPNNTTEQIPPVGTIPTNDPILEEPVSAFGEEPVPKSGEPVSADGTEIPLEEPIEFDNSKDLLGDQLAEPIDEPIAVADSKTEDLFGETGIDSFAPLPVPVPIETTNDTNDTNELEEFRQRVEEYKQDYIFLNTSISTEPNKDTTYKREGVLHFTDSIIATGDKRSYDKLRNIALKKVDILLGENRRCYNTRLHFERNGDTILVHIYGNLYVKKNL